MEAVTEAQTASDVTEWARRQNQHTLDQVIRILKHAYYTGSEALVSDVVYDAIERVAREKGVKIKVGAPVKNGVKLPTYLPSLDKLHTEEDVSRWMGDSGEVVVMDKLDGLTGLCVVERDGDGKKTVKLFTQGDGSEGFDVSYIVPYIVGIPAKLRSGIVRGEFIIPRTQWDQFHAEFPDYKNLRNSVSGIVQDRKHINPEKLKYVHLVAYEIVGSELPIAEQLVSLAKHGWETVWSASFESGTANDLLVRRRDESTYEIDGLVMFKNHPYDRCERDNPDYAVAYKFDFESALTRVARVEWRSRRSSIRPRVWFDPPVVLCGATLSKASGHNAKLIINGCIGPGALVRVIRAKGINPKIEEVLEPAESGEPELPDPAEMPYHFDATETQLIADGTTDEATIHQIHYFYQLQGVKFLGEKIVAKAYRAGFTSIAKIAGMSVADWTTVDGVEDVMAHKLHTNIRMALASADKASVMAGSGCFGLGIGRRKITPVLARLPDVLEVEPSMSQVVGIQGYAEKSAAKFIKGLSKFGKLLGKLAPYLKWRVDEAPKGGDDVTSEAGNTYVFSEIRSKSVEEQIIRRGGRVTTSVSKKTTAVLVKSSTSQSSKIQAARTAGIPVLVLDEFVVSRGYSH